MSVEPEDKKDKTKFEYLGVNHVALVCRDMAETVDFYQNVLDMPLVKAVGIPGGGQHFFFDCGNGATIAFFWFKDAPPPAPGIASQHLDTRKDGAKTAIGSMNHLALNVSEENFETYVNRLKELGLDPKVIHHSDPPNEMSMELTETTWIRSVYFTDPNGIKMEMAALTRPYSDNEPLMDPVDAEGNPVPLKHKVST
jgi:catechol 2,3-dioxygenase-like lactoylglutathione lyase family enzyme